VIPSPLTGANVLLLIREGQANDRESLCRAFGLQPYASYYIDPKVQQVICWVGLSAGGEDAELTVAIPHDREWFAGVMGSSWGK
jgi:hypothetical protein